MKKYRVEIDKDAVYDAQEAAEFIAESSPFNADRWLAGLQQAIESLESMPNRCGDARENEFLKESLKQYIYHSHRIIFHVDESAGVVRILHIRHAARCALGEIPED